MINSRFNPSGKGAARTASTLRRKLSSSLNAAMRTESLLNCGCGIGIMESTSGGLLAANRGPHDKAVREEIGPPHFAESDFPRRTRMFPHSPRSNGEVDRDSPGACPRESPHQA